jgi:hypothetical protein
MMHKSLALLAALALVACTRTETAGGEVDTVADTTARLSVPDIDVGMKRDTVTIPTVEMKKDTFIVNRPVVTGKKQVEIKRPTVDVNKKP